MHLLVSNSLLPLVYLTCVFILGPISQRRVNKLSFSMSSELIYHEMGTLSFCFQLPAK